MPGDYIKIGGGFGWYYLEIIMSNQIQTSIKQSCEVGGSA